MRIIRDINSPFVSGTLMCVHPKVYTAVIEDVTELAMLFCRFQEYYESPMKDIRGCHFSWSKFISMYCKLKGKKDFTYPTDWDGFNLPSESIRSSMWPMQDGCEYADIMTEIYLDCYNDAQEEKFYLIGVTNVEDDTYQHELAHGLWYTNDEYRLSAMELLMDVPESEYKEIRDNLLEVGYVDDKAIMDDEIHAYMLLESSKYSGVFMENFKRFVK